MNVCSLGEVLRRCGRLEVEGHLGGDGRGLRPYSCHSAVGWQETSRTKDRVKEVGLLLRPPPPPILRGVHCNKKGKRNRNGGQRKEVRSLRVCWLPLLPGVPSWVWSPGLEAPWSPTESILEHTRAPLGFCFYSAVGGCPSRSPSSLPTDVDSGGASGPTKQARGGLARAPGWGSSPAPVSPTEKGTHSGGSPNTACPPPPADSLVPTKSQLTPGLTPKLEGGEPTSARGPGGGGVAAGAGL